MRLLRALLLSTVATTCFVQGQDSQQSATATVKMHPSDTVQAPLPPSPPDAPILNEGAMPVPDRSTLKVKRTLQRGAPHCLDAIFHLCWSFPPADGPAYSSNEQRRIAEDLEIGNSYLKEKSYRGAEFRFEDALACQPDNPEATFKLAEALAKLGRNDEAVGAYTRYLQIAPDGVFAKRAKKSQIQLENKKPR